MNGIFVFGSNLAGRHGKGAALFAKEYCGAVYGEGIGMTGRAYAIPTKDENLKPLSFDVVESHIAKFIEFAKENPRDEFMLTPIGCGLAGNSKRDVWAVMAKYGLPSNVFLTSTWVNP